MFPSLSFTGGAGGKGGDATAGDFSGTSGLAGGTGGGSRGIVLTVGKGAKDPVTSSGGDSMLLYVLAGLAALVIIVFLFLRK